MNNTGDNNAVSFGSGQIIASISIIASFVLMTFDQYLIILGDGDTVGDVDDHDFATTTGATTTIGSHPNGSDEELRSMILFDNDGDEDEDEDNILPRSAIS